MNIEFHVFPDYSTFLQRTPVDKKDHYSIKSIQITSNGAFWFTTNKKLQSKFYNANSSYVHAQETLQFDKKPFDVTRDNFKYDPKKKQLSIGDSILPWKSAVWTKSILGAYHGSEIPAKKMKIKGEWILDRNERLIYLILDYAPIIRKNHIYNESATKEQIEYANKLEKEIDDLYDY